MANIRFSNIAVVSVAVVVWMIIGCGFEEHESIDDLIKAGQESFDNDRYDDAVKAWSKAYQAAPERHDLMFRMAKAYRYSARFDQSSQMLQKAIEKGYKMVESYLMTAQNDILVGNFQSARNIINKLETLVSQDYRLILLKGDVASFMGQYFEGEGFYHQAIEFNPRLSDAYFKLAANLLVQEKGAASNEFFEKAVALGDRSSVQYWLHRTEYEALKGDAENAELAMRQALAIGPENVYIQLKIAQLLLAYKKYDNLLELFNPSDDIAIVHPEIQKIIVEALLNTSRLDRALTIIETNSLTGDNEWMLLHGKYSMLKGEFTQAISNFETALEKRKNDPNVHYMLALAYIAANRINLASQTLIQLLSIYPDMVEAEYALAAIHYSKQEYNLSVGYLERIIEKMPENAGAYLLLGNCMLATGRYQDAELNFQKSLALDSGSVPARYFLAVVSEKEGRFEDAIWLYQSIIEDAPEMVDAGLRLANLMSIENRADEAIERFSGMLENRPHDSYLSLILGDLFKLSGKSDQAAEFYRRAIAENSKLIDAYQRLVSLQKDSSEKISILKQALKKLPDATALQMMLANIYFEAGQLDSTIELMERIHALDPRQQAAANNLAWLYLEKGINLSKAFEMARGAFESDPSNPYYAHTLGWAYHQKGINRQAVWYLEESLRLLAEEPEREAEDRQAKGIFSYHLGLVLKDIGKLEEAEEKLIQARNVGLPARYEKQAEKRLK